MTAQPDFIIVGAGYAGLSAAITLGRAGLSVTVIDAQPIGGNEHPLPGYTQSAISGGHVVTGFSQDIDDIQTQYGIDFARDFFKLSVDGIDVVEKFCGECGGAGFRRGYLTLARNKRDDAALVREVENERNFLGIADDKSFLLSAEQTRTYIASPDFQGTSLYSEISGQLEPREYVLGLARLAEQAGVKLLPLTHIISFRIENDFVELTTEDGAILKAAKVIVSGGSAILRGGVFPHMRKYQAVVGNYAVKTDILPQSVIDQIFPTGYHGAFGDMRRSDVLYARLDNQNRLDFGAYSFSGATPNRTQVEELLYSTFPQLKEAKIGLQQGRFGFLVGTKCETVQIFQSQQDGDVVPVNSFDGKSSLTVLSAFGGAGINLGTVAGQAVAMAYLGQPQNINLLARIKHPKLSVTFPWERANQMRDFVLTKALSIVDKGASADGMWGAMMRCIDRLI